MNISKKFTISMIVFFVPILLIMLVVWLFNRDTLIFSPDIVINEVFKAMAGLLPLVFGFLLVNFFWNRKTSEKLIEGVISQLISSAEKIKKSSYLLGQKRDIKPVDAIAYDSRRSNINADLDTIKEEYSSIESTIQSISHSVDIEFLSVTNNCLLTINKYINSLSKFELDHCTCEDDFFSYNTHLGDEALKLYNHFLKFDNGGEVRHVR